MLRTEIMHVPEVQKGDINKAVLSRTKIRACVCESSSPCLLKAAAGVSAAQKTQARGSMRTSVVARADQSLRPDDGRVHFRVSLGNQYFVT